MNKYLVGEKVIFTNGQIVDVDFDWFGVPSAGIQTGKIIGQSGTSFGLGWWIIDF
jgi:hypothetical protein